MKHLFDRVLQFQPGKMQQGEGSGFGLLSESNSPFLLCKPSLAIRCAAVVDLLTTVNLT